MCLKVNDSYQLRLWVESTSLWVGPPPSKDFAPVLFRFSFQRQPKAITGAKLYNKVTMKEGTIRTVKIVVITIVHI